MYGYCTAISKYNLELKEGYFGTKGKITRQKFNFTEQHRQFQGFQNYPRNSRFYRVNINLAVVLKKI